MSHHSESPVGSETRRIFEELTGKPWSNGAGPTGKYPRGKLSEDDSGEIAIAIAADPKTGTILIDFGKPTAWIGFTPRQAVELAEDLNRKAWELRGISPPLPLTVHKESEAN